MHVINDRYKVEWPVTACSQLLLIFITLSTYFVFVAMVFDGNAGGPLI